MGTYDERDESSGGIGDDTWDLAGREADADPRYQYLGAVIWDEGHRPGGLYRDRKDRDLLFAVPVSLLPLDTGPDEAVRWFRQRMGIPGWADVITVRQADLDGGGPCHVFGLPDTVGVWDTVRRLDVVAAPQPTSDGPPPSGGPGESQR